MSEPRGTRCRFLHRVPLRFSDLDLLGHVNHIAYIDILESGRIAYYHEVMGVTSVREIRFALVDLRIRYFAQAHYGQTMRVGVRTTWLKRSSSGFVFSICDDETDREVASGEGVQVYLDLEQNLAQPLPEAMRKRVIAFEGEGLEER